jgi:hypothetical protein
MTIRKQLQTANVISKFASSPKNRLLGIEANNKETNRGITSSILELNCKHLTGTLNGRLFNRNVDSCPRDISKDDE